MNKKSLLIALALLAVSTARMFAQYPGWQHTGSLYLLTTPEGANLPATEAVENFPVLVRLKKDWFDFSQAKANGEDLRFASSEGAPLAYEIEEWDAVNGTAAIWVRVPAIKGNARQAIKMFWGKADAASESNAKAVFNDSNGYLAVFHMANPVRDELGAVTAKDLGTTPVAGLIGEARHFAGDRGVNCGEAITNLPAGASDHTTEVWVKPQSANAPLVAWGNQQGQGKVVMTLASPPHIEMDCFFSGANVKSGAVPLAQWLHIVHTFKKGESRIYVNGALAGESKFAGNGLDIRTPARLYLGGWYGQYPFVGDMDEVRLSKVTRSAAWVKLEYENQKALQTLVGPLVQAGTDFGVKEKSVTVQEGQRATVTAKAVGAQKIYWIAKRNGTETVVAVDQSAYTIDAGRVTGDQNFTLQFQAVYPDQVRTQDIAVTIREAIPDPVFTLKAPAKWNGRDTIEVVPQMANLLAMQAKGVGDVKYNWIVSGMAVIQEIAAGKLILKRSQNSGTLTVTASISNGGAPVTQTAQIAVTEPKQDAWVQRTPDKDEKPFDNQFYARDDKNEGTLYYNGTLDKPADTVFLKLYADDKLVKTETQKLAADKHYVFALKLKPGLIKYRIEFGTQDATETVLNTATNLVCGDAYLIDGQSNALATDTDEPSPLETSDWIRSYGGPTGRGDATKWRKDLVDQSLQKTGRQPNLWANPVWKAKSGEQVQLGWWGMELAKRLVASQKMPVCIIQAAVGGTRIDQHQPNPANHQALDTMYGRMLWRVDQAKLTHGIRAVIWHQGENDQGSDGPDGGYGSETYQKYFVNMAAAWKQDMPNIQHYYIFQIWPNSCAMGGGHGDMLREVQRNLPQLYRHMDILSTLGVKPPGGCHYPLAGWSKFAEMLQPLIERDFYGVKAAGPLAAPNLQRAYFSNPAKNEITLEFDQPVVWDDSLVSEFYLDDVPGKVAAGSTAGNRLTLKLTEASAAKKITYLKEMSWSQNRLLIGKNGLAALTFCAVPISPDEKH